MEHEMSRLRATANEHMRRDIEAGGKWACGCEACAEIRSLIGMDKLLELWPLVREIQDIEERLPGMEDGPKRRMLRERYLQLYYQLAEQMGK